jgi:hypothetical protein
MDSPAVAPLEPAPRVMPVKGYVMGVDIAFQGDYTALSVVEARYLEPTNAPWTLTETGYSVVHLERWRDLPIEPTVDRILERFKELRDVPERTEVAPRMIVDATGVGLPVLHMLRRRHSNVTGVMIHGGDAESRGDGVERVPKRNLVSQLQVALQRKRLRIARDLPLAGTLATELRGFRVRITATGHDTYGNDVASGLWREADHDDLVLGVALAVWSSERRGGASLAALRKAAGLT